MMGWMAPLRHLSAKLLPLNPANDHQPDANRPQGELKPTASA